MTRQKSEIGLEAANVMRGDSSGWDIVGSRRERRSLRRVAPVLISLGKTNIITSFMNQDVTPGCSSLRFEPMSGPGPQRWRSLFDLQNSTIF